MIGYTEGAAGAGMLLGPVIGSLLYLFADYQGTFYIFSILIFIGCIINMIWFPKRINSSK